MKVKTLTLLLSISVLFTACKTTPRVMLDTVIAGETPRTNSQEESRWELMVGTWHGRQQRSDGGVHEWIVIRHHDGSYLMRFKRTSSSGLIEYSTETGLWGVSGDSYFIIFQGWIKNGRFQETDLKGQYTRDAYRIIRLDEDEMIYSSLEEEATFRIVRVSEDFDFPRS